MRLNQKALMYPLRVSLAVMLFTVLVYIFGPIRWIKSSSIYEIIAIILLMSYIFAFALGYYVTVRRNIKNEKEKTAPDSLIILKWEKWLKVTIVANLVITMANAFLYVGVSNLSGLWDKMNQGILSPSSVYYHKDASSRAGSVIVWISFLYSPLLYITNVLSLYLFRKLHIIYKVIVIITLLLEIMRWIALGTNKGLFDIVILIFSVYMIKKIILKSDNNHSVKSKRQTKLMRIMVIIVIITFFSFFGYAMSARVKGSYSESNFQSFPYNLVPENQRVLVEKFDSYLVQGYDNFEKIIENCSFKWTFGIGNSRFLLSIVDRAFNTNITDKTYPYQLEEFGVDPLVSWHSAYAWWASDMTFLGVILLMFFAGKLLANITKDIIIYQDPISITLFYLLVLSIFNASCTNYVLAYTNGFMAFWSLLIVYLLKKHGIKIVIKKP